MSTNQQYSVYVLKSLKDHQNYTGLSADVEKRIKMHNAGKVKSTKSRRPFQLIYHEFVGSLTEARLREIYFKSSTGRKYLEKILTKNTKIVRGSPA
jgi:putative endonuclease